LNPVTNVLINLQQGAKKMQTNITQAAAHVRTCLRTWNVATVYVENTTSRAEQK